MWLFCVWKRSESWVGAWLCVIVTDPVCEGASLSIRSMWCVTMIIGGGSKHVSIWMLMIVYLAHSSLTCLLEDFVLQTIFLACTFSLSVPIESFTRSFPKGHILGSLTLPNINSFLLKSSLKDYDTPTSTSPPPIHSSTHFTLLLPLPAYGNPLSKVINGHKSKVPSSGLSSIWDGWSLALFWNTPCSCPKWSTWLKYSNHDLATFLTSVNGATL